jgi:hypothetical protein
MSVDFQLGPEITEYVHPLYTMAPNQSEVTESPEMESALDDCERVF